MSLLGLSPLSLGIKVLAGVVAAFLIFGSGYYLAVSQYDAAAQSAAAAATKAQAAKDAADYADAKADMQKRATADSAAAVVYQTIYRERKVLVPSPAQCVVSAAAMKELNNPQLIGTSP